MTKSDLKTDLEYHKSAKKALQQAYIAIAEGGAQQYTIGSRSLSKLDLSKISAEIAAHDRKIGEIEAVLGGGSRRKAVGVVISDW